MCANEAAQFITLVGGMGAWLLAPHAATGQPSDRIRRIAMLSGFAATDPEAQARVAALQQGLKELGWAEGRNVSIEFRWGAVGALKCVHSQASSSSSSGAESTLDAELNDFGAQLAMLGGHAADRDGEAEAARPGTARIEKECAVFCLDLGLVRMTIDHRVDLVGGLGVKLGQNV
jgi:hypothetical protein